MMSSFIFFRSEESENSENIRHRYVQSQENTSPRFKQPEKNSGAVLRRPFSIRSLRDLCLLPRGCIKDAEHSNKYNLYDAKIQYAIYCIKRDINN